MPSSNERDDAVAAYRRCCAMALRKLLGWPPSRARRWTKRLNDRDGWLLHERAMYYVASLLVPEPLQCPEALTRDKMRGHSLRELEFLEKLSRASGGPDKLPGLSPRQFEGLLEHALNYGDDLSMRGTDPDAGLSGEAWLARHMERQAFEVRRGLWLSESEPELYDWDAARQRLQNILAELGQSLPRPDFDWPHQGSPHRMLDWLSQCGKVSRRKLRLFACACVRRVWDLLDDERSRKAVEIAEKFADGQASTANLKAALRHASEVMRILQYRDYPAGSTDADLAT